MTSTFTCPECGNTTELVTKAASGSFNCQCSSCEHHWLSNNEGKVMNPTEPDGASHPLRLGQRAGHVAVLASMPTRKALNVLAETPMETTSWAFGIPKRREPVAHDMVQRDSTELGPVAPAAKSQTAALAAIPKTSFRDRWANSMRRRQERPKLAPRFGGNRVARGPEISPSAFDYSGPIQRHSIESQAADLVAQVVERQRHPCAKCGGEGEVASKEEPGEKTICPSCMGSGTVKRRQRQEAVPANPQFQLRPMTANDLSGFSGVEEPENGQPLIGETTIDGRGALVMVGRDQVHVIIDGPEGYTDSHEFMFPIPFSQGAAFAQQIGRATTTQELLGLGFEQIR